MGWRWPKLADQRGSAGYAAARVVNECSNAAGEGDCNSAEGSKHPPSSGKLLFRDIGSAHTIPAGNQTVDLVSIAGAAQGFARLSHGPFGDTYLLIKSCAVAVVRLNQLVDLRL